MEPTVDFGVVHATVLRQHEDLRGRLLDLGASAAPGASSRARASLRGSLLELAEIFESHLQFEERELVPRIREVDAWGSQRAREMLIEHVEQRARLAHACVAAERDGTSDPELVEEVSLLATTLLDDMAREERELDDLEIVSTGAAVEQITG